MEHLKGASLRQAPDLPANIRLYWKGLPDTNTLAYYENSQIAVVKGFITSTPDHSRCERDAARDACDDCDDD